MDKIQDKKGEEDVLSSDTEENAETLTSFEKFIEHF